MIVFVCKILVYEWCWFLLVVLVMCFVGVLLIVQVVLVLGIFGIVVIYVKVFLVDFWVGFFGIQSVNYGYVISVDVESYLCMDLDVICVEFYEWVDGEWWFGVQGIGNVLVYLFGIFI